MQATLGGSHVDMDTREEGLPGKPRFSAQPHVGRWLSPFFLTCAVYFLLWNPENQPSWVGALIKCLPILYLVVFLWTVYPGGSYSLLLQGALLCSAVGDSCLVWPEAFLHVCLLTTVSGIVRSYGAIVGATVSPLLFLILVGLLVFFLKRRHKKSEKKPAPRDLVFSFPGDVLAEDFADHVRKHEDSGCGFAEEYQPALEDHSQSQMVASAPENSAKNRYRNVLPWSLEPPGVHCSPGPPPPHCGRLLAPGVGAAEPHTAHADQLRGVCPDERTPGSWVLTPELQPVTLPQTLIPG